ncbi:hypothetical protein CEXT_730471 [Caerostris extrusa]|uniref:Uncharacterized protein n=1 Tax=Caerostris extrusa TaxID=172846 RepID=A0AAV4NFX0_CAEEX|nr:hypothetical protein CEXT_730471 [Caerostris extrusa]
MKSSERDGGKGGEIPGVLLRDVLGESLDFFILPLSFVSTRNFSRCVSRFLRKSQFPLEAPSSATLKGPDIGFLLGG